MRTVYVPVFLNDTAEAGMGAWCADALRMELSRRNREGGELSDGRVEGRIVEIRDPTAIYTTDGEGRVKRTSARVSAVVEIRLLRGSELLRSFRVRGSEDYLVSSAVGTMAVLEDDSARRLALRRLSERLMHDAWERLQTF